MPTSTVPFGLDSVMLFSMCQSATVRAGRAAIALRSHSYTIRLHRHTFRHTECKERPLYHVNLFSSSLRLSRDCVPCRVGCSAAGQSPEPHFFPGAIRRYPPHIPARILQQLSDLQCRHEKHAELSPEHPAVARHRLSVSIWRSCCVASP